MRTLVTGGAGFIGSHLVDRLLHEGHTVSVIDDLTTGRLNNIKVAMTSSEFSFYRLDTNSPELFEVFSEDRPEVVFHLAAQIDVRASVVDPITDATRNVLGTINVAQAAHRHHARKLIFASSGGSIYGAPSTLPVSEAASIAPMSPYAASKVAGEVYLNTYRRLHNVDCTHLALANVYGPRQAARGEAGVIAIFTRALRNGEKTTVFGDGGNTRDYVYVDDVVSAFCAAAGSRGGGQRYNIGTGVQTSDRELHSLIAESLDVSDEPRFAPARQGDVRASALNSHAAYADLGWCARVSVAEGVHRTIQYLRSTPHEEIAIHAQRGIA